MSIIFPYSSSVVLNYFTSMFSLDLTTLEL